MNSSGLCVAWSSKLCASDARSDHLRNRTKAAAGIHRASGDPWFCTAHPSYYSPLAEIGFWTQNKINGAFWNKWRCVLLGSSLNAHLSTGVLAFYLQQSTPTMEETSGLLQSTSWLQNLRQQLKINYCCFHCHIGEKWDKPGQSSSFAWSQCGWLLQINLTVSVKCEPPFKY